MRVGQARKRDANEPAIVEALRRVGAQVIRLSERGAPDLLVLWRQRVILMEIKTAVGRATLAQERRSDEGWPVVTCRTVDEALGALQPVSGVGR